MYTVKVKLLMRVFLGIVVLIALVGIGSVLAFNSGLFQSYLEKKAQAALGDQIHLRLGATKIQYRWPPLVRIEGSQVDHPLAQLDWRTLELEVNPLRSPLEIHVALDHPKVILKATNAEAEKPQSQAASMPPSAAPPSNLSSLGLKLNIHNGEVQSPWGNVSSLNLTFEQKLLLQSSAALHLEASFHPNVLPLPLPIELNTPSMVLSPKEVSAKELSARFAGLAAVVQGASSLLEGRHQWSVRLSAPDLAQLPTPPPGPISLKNWKGGVQLQADLSKASTQEPWRASGNFLVKDMAAHLDGKMDQASVNGGFLFDGEGRFLAHDGVLEWPNLRLSADFTEAKVIYADLLHKEPRVPLKVSLSGVGAGQKFDLRELNFQLWKLSGGLNGSLELAPPYLAQFQFRLKPTSLIGAEVIFPPLKASPVQGEISVNGRMDGPLTDYAKARIVLETMALKKFAAAVNWEREGVLGIRGPVQADVTGRGEWNQGKIKFAEGQGFVDLSAAALVMGPLRKEQNANFKGRFDIRNVGSAVVINEMDLNSFIGRFSAKGKVEMKDLPVMNLQVEAKPLSLSELRVAAPAIRDLLPKGTLTGKGDIKGQLDTRKTWSDWPLVISGNLELNLPEYKVASSEALGAGAKKASPAPSQGSEATSFLPDGELTRKMRVRVRARVDRLQKDSLILKSVSTNGQLVDGRYLGEVEIGEVFGGSAQIKALKLPLLQKNPLIEGSANWLDITIEDLLGFVKPEYKAFASGKTAGVAEFATVLPSQADFLQRLRVRGDAAAQPVTFNSVKIGEMVNAQMTKVPLLKLKPMKVDPLRGQAKMKFDLRNGVVDVVTFNGVDVDNSEIQLKGKVTLNAMEGDLAGTFFWSNPSVKGCMLEGNQDGKGRMIVPFALRGNLLSPGLSVLNDVLGQLAAKAAGCEGKKLLDKAKGEGQQKLEKELKKTLKGLFGN